jgi:hypothetical protein
MLAVAAFQDIRIFRPRHHLVLDDAGWHCVSEKPPISSTCRSVRAWRLLAAPPSLHRGSVKVSCEVAPAIDRHLAR